jgi:hypothetical protein
MAYERMSGIREKIKRAEKHIDEFKVEVKRFLDHDPKPYALCVDVETEPSEPTVHVLKADPVPPGLLAIAGDAIHNLRSALDHLVFALASANNFPVGKMTEYPIFEGPITTAKVEARFEEKVEGMRKEVIEALRRVHPYPGGNDTLWRLHSFDVIDKHKMLVAALGRITAVNGFPPVVGEWDRKRWVGITGVPLVLEEGQQFTIPNAKLDKNTEFFAEVVFNQPDVAEGYPIMMGLLQFRAEVMRVIGDLSFGLK